YNRPQNNRGSNHSANQGTRGNLGGEKLTCFKCGKEGHYATDYGNPRAGTFCYNCREEEHFARDYKAPKAGPPVNANQGARPTAKGRVYCMGTE
ncbi:enzymatic polyprotein, partial [Trifolium medium]|nr:enzymatic polyprotein [Trifolium medium]